MKDEKKEDIKLLPSSEEAEKALLGCAIIGGEREV